MANQLEFGVIGLGRMGGGLALQAIKKGMRVVGLDRNPPQPELTKAGLVFAKSNQELVKHLLDLGTSGGLLGAETGACFMLGGEREPVSRVEPILKQLCVKEGYVHAGPAGSGHFVKLA